MPAIGLYPYQQRWFAERCRFKIGMFARQTGKTFTTTLEIVDSVLEAEASGKRQRWVILSRGERQAREAMDEGVKRHLQAYNAAFRSLEESWTGEATYRALEVQTAGGSKITALPANPDTARGFSANVFLDEFAFHADSRKIWAALFPVISAGHRIVVVSTPNGKSNKFYELMTGQDSTWYRQTVDIHQAVADGLPRDIQALKDGLHDDDAWAQEYELQWLDEASAWLDYELIAAAEHPEAGAPEKYTGGPCYVGMDIGRRQDLTVIWVAEKLGDVLWCREVVRMKRQSFAAQDAELDRIMRAYDVAFVCMDQTGMGEKMVEDAQKLYGRHRVAGVLFTLAAKQELAIGGKQRFEDRRVRIPIDRLTRESHHAVKKVVGATGVPRFDAERTDAGHADEFWAHMLAIHAAWQPAGAIEFESTGKRRTYTQTEDY